MNPKEIGRLCNEIFWAIPCNVTLCRDILTSPKCIKSRDILKIRLSGFRGGNWRYEIHLGWEYEGEDSIDRLRYKLKDVLREFISSSR